jgi:DNA-directed RNA polymerase subunit RPC12/RpoP
MAKRVSKHDKQLDKQLKVWNLKMLENRLHEEHDAAGAYTIRRVLDFIAPNWRAAKNYSELMPKMAQEYVCPDCGWKLKTRAYRIKCGNCGSLNLERLLPDGRLIKADADETAPENAKLIHSADT